MIETVLDKAIKSKKAKGEMKVLSRATSQKIDVAVSNSFKKHNPTPPLSRKV